MNSPWLFVYNVTTYSDSVWNCCKFLNLFHYFFDWHENVASTEQKWRRWLLSILGFCTDSLLNLSFYFFARTFRSRRLQLFVLAFKFGLRIWLVFALRITLMKLWPRKMSSPWKFWVYWRVSPRFASVDRGGTRVRLRGVLAPTLGKLAPFGELCVPNTFDSNIVHFNTF